MSKQMVNESYDEFDRTIHARYPGVEVVSYVSTGEWYLEPIKDDKDRSVYWNEKNEKLPLKGKKKVSVEEAARNAAQGVWMGWQPNTRVWPTGGLQVFFEQEGGEEFDERVKEICPPLFAEVQHIDLGDGHEYIGLKCPGCGEMMRVGDVQIGNNTCTYHSKVDGGCGFHGYTGGHNAGYIVDLGPARNLKLKL